MTSLLETIKEHDAKMESQRKDIQLLEQALIFLVDDLIDRSLTLCLDERRLKPAYQLLKDRGMIDSWRIHEWNCTEDGLCDTSVKLKHVHKTITGVED